MLKVAFSSSFQKALKKRIERDKVLEKRFWETLEIFIHDPFDERLRTHKLSGKLKELWSFTMGYDVRVIFYFSNKDKAVFIDIGKHDEVY